jgi:hypothetical protein
MAACGLVLLACASGGTSPDACEIRVVGVEQWSVRNDGLDAAYRVRGVAGSPGTTWLAGRTTGGQYVPGYGVDVGPGPFEAIVDLKLTGEPHEFIAVLEVAGRRCKADAKKPS